MSAPPREEKKYGAAAASEESYEGDGEYTTDGGDASFDPAGEEGAATAAAAPNLAYIVRVADLQPIPDKDLIELASVKGWKCVVRKDQFAVGDLAVYLAVGSVPDLADPKFAFMVKGGHKRVRTAKIGGVISQGLLGPMTWVYDAAAADGAVSSAFAEGDDVSVRMGVTKYIAPEELGQYDNGGHENRNAVRRTAFPDCVPKTDAERLQHDPARFFSALRGHEDVTVTRKEDGCSCTFVHNRGVYQLCGRNFVWRDPEDRDNTTAHYFAIQDKYDMPARLAGLGRNLAIQGEICGPKINGNRMRLASRTFSVFDVYDIDARQYLPYDELCGVCAALGLNTVPLLFRGPAAELPAQDVEGFLAMADGVEYAPGVPGEGIVVKADATASRRRRVHFKTISNNYLLKHDV